MEATRPLLGGDSDDRGNGVAPNQHYYQLHNYTADYSSASRRRGSLFILDAPDDSCCSSCSRVICCLSSVRLGGGGGYTRVASPTSAYKDTRDELLSDSTDSTGSSASHNHRGGPPHHAATGYEALVCTSWACWKWMFPARVRDYDDFATSEEVR
jgi:hypothetical protein